MLSPWQINYKGKYKTTEKLLTTQYNKFNYIIEGRMLDWYLDHGMILSKIHKKLIYKKSNWLEQYIRFNINERNKSKEAKDKFGDFFYKLMNNAFYGKTLENVRNRQNIEIVNSEERFTHLASKPSFQRFTIFNDTIAAMHMKKSNIYFNKFPYIGFVILELSKLTMYSFIYDVLYPIYGDKYRIHATDTDSIYLELLDGETPDKIKDYVDNNELGKFKNEYPNDIIIRACFIKSKMNVVDRISKDDKSS